MAAAIGTFSITTTASGLTLNGSNTISVQDGVSRLSSLTGKIQYQCDEGGVLRGGTMQFADGQAGTLWQFSFSGSNYNEMYMVNETFPQTRLALTHVFQGYAVRIDNQQACPATPNLVLDSSFSAPRGWSIHTESAGELFTFNNSISTNGSGSVGFLNFRSNAGRDGSGAITGNLTTAVGANGYAATSSVIRLADTAGRYQVYGPGAGIGCSGGNMSFMVGPWAVQYEFVFADGAHSKIFILSTLATASGPDNGWQPE